MLEDCIDMLWTTTREQKEMAGTENSISKKETVFLMFFFNRFLGVWSIATMSFVVFTVHFPNNINIYSNFALFRTISRGEAGNEWTVDEQNDGRRQVKI